MQAPLRSHRTVTTVALLVTSGALEAWRRGWQRARASKAHAAGALVQSATLAGTACHGCRTSHKPTHCGSMGRGSQPSAAIQHHNSTEAAVEEGSSKQGRWGPFAPGLLYCPCSPTATVLTLQTCTCKRVELFKQQALLSRQVPFRCERSSTFLPTTVPRTKGPFSPGDPP